MSNGTGQPDSEPPVPEVDQRIAEMTELAGGLAHELRNPLSTMMVNLKLLAEDLEDHDQHHEDAIRRALLKVAVLRHEAERLQKLFDAFLSLTRPYQLERSDTDINAMVSRLAEFIRPQTTGQGIDLQLALASEPLRCRVDENLLRQALLNLLRNAQQAMAGGGVLRLTTEDTGDGIRIHVSDTGLGIAPAQRDRILRPFFSTKASGNGLGLSITQRIIAEHGGSLSFSSNPGPGTTFIVHLPGKCPP